MRLVTGASGFAGEHLVRRLTSSGVPVTALYGSNAVSTPGADVRRLDLSCRESALDLVKECRPDVVYHTAAQTNVAYCESHPEEARRAIVDVTRNLAEAMAEFCPSSTLVHLSTDLVYDGTRRSDEPGYCEKDVPNPLSTYSKLKLESENAVLDLPNGCVIRSALIYGPPSTHKSSALGWMMDTLRAGKELVLFEDELRTPIYIDDLCIAMIELSKRKAKGIWHAGGEDRQSRLQMGHIVCEVFDLPQSLLRPAKLSESTYSAPRPANVALDSGKLWSTIKHTPKTFREGVTECRRSSPPRPLPPSPPQSAR